MKYFLWLLRIVVGVLFIFSGLVKANDPMGLVYKMDEFFEALNMTFMMHWSYWFSLVMIAFEIVCGFAVLLGYSFRFFSTLLVLLNFLFLFITAYALFTGKVKECGCFGACIKISNDATFYKDIALTIMALILFFYRNRIHGLFSKGVNTAIMVCAVLLASGVQAYAIKHLPFYDCLAYKPGNNLWQKMQPAPGSTPPVFQTNFVYEKNGVKKNFTSENYPWQDSTWKFVSSESKMIKEGTGQPEIPHDFAFTDSDGADQTQALLTAKGYVFYWFIREPQKAHMENMDRLRALMTKAESLHIPFYTLSSVGYEDALPYRKQWNIMDIPMMTLDGTVSKTAMRANPGLMLMKDGIVVKKWSYADYPSDMVLNNGTLDIK
jgi:uncharacterized membrane protein YphA (DoxX/SURF4 family)